MNIQEFNALCTQYCILPSVALDNDDVVSLLLSMRNTNNGDAMRGYRNLLIRVLETQF